MGNQVAVKKVHLITASDALTHRSKMFRKQNESSLVSFVTSELYEILSAALILANCLMIMVQLEYISSQAQLSVDLEREAWIIGTEVLFVALFALDLFLRVMAHGTN